MKIKISEEFSPTPGARYRNEGKFSGEEFRDDMLKEKFDEARRLNEKLIVDLDGGYGYPTSFLEEAFGGLSRLYSPAEVMKVLEFVSNDEPSLIEEINHYILAANEKR